MTPQQIEHAMSQTLVIATTAAQLSASIALVLHTKGLLTESDRSELANKIRHVGETFQEAGSDDHASDFGAIAALLQRPRG